MKLPLKTTSLASAIAALALALPASAAVPHRWTVETTRISPEQIEAYRGETLALEATFNAYGKPLETALESPVYLYWQTNGMGTVYWVTNATVAASNVLSTSFLPSFAPAASAVQGFIGSPSSSYRASFVIRFRNAPGETPNVLPLPAQAIDFNTITIYNPPYYTKAEVDEKVANATPSDYETVKTKANSAVQPADLTSATNGLASQSSLTSLSSRVDAVSDAIPTAVSDLSDAKDYLKTADLADNETDPKFNAWTNNYYIAIGNRAICDNRSENIAIGYCSTSESDEGTEPSIAIGSFARASSRFSTAIGPRAESHGMKTISFSYSPDGFYLATNSWSSTYRTLQSYLDERATTNALAAVEAKIPVIDATDATFSNAVLAVGLNIDTNSVAVLNELAKDFGGFPLSAGQTATTVGGLLAALAAALAALKKSVSTLSDKVDDANAALEEVA